MSLQFSSTPFLVLVALIAMFYIQGSYSQINQPVNHEFSVFSGPLGSGDGILLRNKYAELRQYRPFLDAGRSYCYIGGPWSMYQFENFTGALDSLPYTDIRRCYDRGFSDVQSLRYLGPANVSTQAVSMYQGTQGGNPSNSVFGGPEIIFEGTSATNFSFIPTGLIISGYSEWTAWTLPDFTGNETCFNGVNTVAYMVIPRTPILSLSKGCSNNNTAAVHNFLS